MTPQQELILEAIAEGLDPDEAADLAGVSREVLRNWKAIAEGADTYRDGSGVSESVKNSATEFYRELPRAAAMGKRELLAKLRHNAMTLNPRTNWFDTQAIDKILSKSAFRGSWYEHRQSQQTITVEHQPAHELAAAMTTEQLLMLAAPEPDASSP